MSGCVGITVISNGLCVGYAFFWVFLVRDALLLGCFRCIVGGIGWPSLRGAGVLGFLGLYVGVLVLCEWVDYVGLQAEWTVGFPLNWKDSTKNCLRKNECTTRKMYQLVDYSLIFFFFAEESHVMHPNRCTVTVSNTIELRFRLVLHITAITLLKI